MTKQINDPQQALYNFFEFDEADLSANRRGEFSEKQKRDLQAASKSSRKTSILLGPALMMIGLAILFLLVGPPWLQDAGMDWVDLVNMATPLLVALAFMGVGVSVWYGGLKTRAGVAKHRVKSVTGPADIAKAGTATYRYPRRERILYELRVGGREFHAYPGLPDAIVVGEVYAVYFDDADDEILSLEWLAQESA